MKSNKGQSLIESLAALSFLLPMVTLLLASSYLFYSKALSSYLLYRSLICLEEHKVKQGNCKKQLDKNSSQFLFFHTIHKVSLNKGRFKHRAQIKSSFLHFDFDYKKQIGVKL